MKTIGFKLVILLTVLISFSLNHSANAQLNRDVIQLFEAVGDSAGSQLGYQVAGLGDQNGDGYDDILTSAPGDRKAFIYFGGNPIDTIPDLVFQKESDNQFGCCICNLGDTNGDSFDDFAIGSVDLVRIYWGGPNLDTLADWIICAGTNLSAAGDVNGDGYADILLSNVNWQSGKGQAKLYFGDSDPDSIVDWSVIGDSIGYHLGDEIVGRGDINCDSYADIAISGWRQISHKIYPYIKVYYGGAEMDTAPAFVMDSLEEPLDIGVRAAFIDVHRDDLSDLCVDSFVDTSALIFYGPIVPNVNPDLVLNGSFLSGKVWELSGAGDINNDGYPDIITGNYDGWNSLGEVLVFLGGPYMDGWADVTFTGFGNPYKGAGRSVGKAGDVNGDGVDDILFGAWTDWGDNKEGRVMIFSGDTSLTSVSLDTSMAIVPHCISLQQNYPNPFNTSTAIEYQILVDQPIRTLIKIFNILGQEVFTLVDEYQQSGTYQVEWDGKDQSGNTVGSGIYFYRMQVGEFIQFGKMLLLE